ncbi:MAG: DUF2141 domain-containing protein [Pseudomonadota bacterium]
MNLSNFTALLLITVYCAPSVFAADIVVTVTGLKSATGNIIARLHADPESFPMDPSKGVAEISVPITDKTTTFTLEDIDPGTYALAVVHDENGNNKLDFNRLSIPKEPVGFSNNAKGFMGPPKFKKAQFSVEKDDVALNVRVK